MKIVIGYGEIGKAVGEVFGIKCWIDVEKSNPGPFRKYTITHICLPWSEDFVDIVNEYILKYDPIWTIVHSTIPIGTMEQLNGTCFHAPVRGRHENLPQGIMEYEMYLSGTDSLELFKVGEYIGSFNIRVRKFQDFRVTEAAKLLSLLQYGMSVEFARYANSVCEEFGLDYSEAVKGFTKGYNKGIVNDNPNLVKTILEPPDGKIGGHCVLPAIKILNNQIQDTILTSILEKNHRYGNTKNMATL